MILKWKTILTNWMNCYTSETEKIEQNITPENLLNIFTHIHESFRLDDSKSSKFEANTIQDFIVEKYPSIKFENGTLEVTCEEEVYIVASLLLFFICVNSKNAEMKRTMCSNLSAGDQETIMKFSKSLLDCSPILYADVEAAITGSLSEKQIFSRLNHSGLPLLPVLIEACGSVTSATVAETPPALRSLHGEVRRLQAALDAERFDRNYLQDELARTNLKLEKLTKDKEQYKLDILNLKAKISLCCGEKREQHREARADEFIAKLQRQLQELETRLEDTLSQLDDVQQERDTYKQKVAVLKQERDKWLSLSQQEADRAGQLADQLDTERRTVATLRDLVSELRQHNRNNGLDSSMLECDDPDTSIQSLNNLSLCNEVCANVIEVQLGEERAKIEDLKQQIQSLQEQLARASQVFESEKLALEAVITEKDNNLFNLHQRVNEEIQEKNKLKSKYEQEIDDLNKNMLEMSQLLKDLEEKSKQALKEKVQEIQTMQKHFADETDKLGNFIKNLQEKLEEVNNSKEQCDKVIVKLNNKIAEMSQTLKDLEESSKLALGEKEQEISLLQQKYADEMEKTSNVIRNLQMEIKEQNTLKTQCDQEIYVLSRKIAEMSQIIENLEDKSKHMLEEKEKSIHILQLQLSDETEKSGIIIEKLQEEIKDQINLKTKCEQEIDNLNHKVAEISQVVKNVEVNSKHLVEEKEKDILMLRSQLVDETKKSGDIIKKFQEDITEQNNLKLRYEQEIVDLNDKIVKMSQAIKDVEESSKLVLTEKEQEITSLKQHFADETKKTKDILSSLRDELKEQNNSKIHCEQEVIKLNNRIVEISQTMDTLEEKSRHLLEEKENALKALRQKHSDYTEKSGQVIKKLKEEIKEQNNAKVHCDEEIHKLNKEIVAMTQTIKNIEENSKHVTEEKEIQIRILQQQLTDENKKTCNEIAKLKEEIKEQSNLKIRREEEITQLNNKIVEMSQAINHVEKNSKHLQEEKEHEIQVLQQQLAEELEKSSNIIRNLQERLKEQSNLRTQYEQEIVELKNKIVETSQAMKNVEVTLEQLIQAKDQEIQVLQQQSAAETEKSSNVIKNFQKEIEEHCHSKNGLEQDILALNNKIVEMSKIMKDVEESAKRELEETEQEMKSAQQQFSEEIKKLEIKNKILEIEILEAYELKKGCDQDIVKLNSTIAEMSQTAKMAEESSNLALEDKTHEKHSLQQQFTQERETLENIIKDLNKTHETEKHTQLNLKRQLQEKDMFIEELQKEVQDLTVSVSSLEKRYQNMIEEKQKEVQSLNQEIAKLINKTDEMSQTVNYVEIALEEKVKELQSQQQQFTVEREKLENINKNLKIELEAEKYAQLKLKDDFDNRIMKLNEKVLNRNNELVELQNNIIQKSELIEVIKSDLRREKELRDELSNTCNHQLSSLNEEKNAIETDIQQKLHEISTLQKQMHEKKIFTDKLNKEIENLTTSISNLEEKCRHRDGIIKEKQKEIEFLNDVFQKEQEKLNHKIDERNASIKSLQMQLQNEIEYKIKLQKELSTLESSKLSLSEELNAAKILIKDYEEKTLAWEKQKNEMKEQIQGNIQRVNKLQEEKTMLLKEVDVLKELQSGETKDHEEKIFVLEKQKIEMHNQMQANNLKIEKLQDDKASILKEMDELKGALSKETNKHEQKTIMWEKQKTELEEQIKVNVLKVEKLEDERVLLVKELEAVKTVHTEQTKDYEEKMVTWGKQTNDVKEQIQENILKIEQLEDEKAVLLEEVEALKAAQSEESKNHEELVLTCEKQKMEMNEQMQTNSVRVKELEDENAMLVKEIKALKTVHSEEAKDHEENALIWDKQTTELKEQIEANIIRIEKLENEKADLVKEVEVLKIGEIEKRNDHEEKALMWVRHKLELDEKMRVFVVKVENLEDEKAMLLKEMEALKTVQTKEIQQHEENAKTLVKQADELKEQIHSNILKIEKLEDEKAELLKEIEELKTVQTEGTKAHQDKTLMWEKEMNELKEQIQVNLMKVEKLEEERTVLLKEMEVLKAVEKAEKERQENTWEKEKIEMRERLRANAQKAKELEEKKEKLMKTIEELMAGQMDTCFKKEHEEKIQMLEKKEKELKEQMQADIIKVDKLEQEKVMLLKELEALKAAQKEMLAAASQERIIETKHTSWEKESQGMHHQVDTTTSDLAHSSMESLKTISDLEKIIQDKNRKITSMQIEISYIKSMMAESGIKLIDVTKELEVSKDTCQELSSQLKKLVIIKNEEISELKRQVAKMSATENRASQIIKLSAKYQAMILKRIAEIKSSAVLKELTNFSNQNSNGDDLRRSIGSVTMEDLENFLETTDRHLKRCSEKQLALQKDRDRLSEVNRINESEIINMKKFLTEMSVSFRTFTTVKEVYNQKLSKIVSLQRTVRRDILSLDGRITEATMCKLERGYAAVMQDLSECAMNLERWVDRSVSRLLSSEKIKQAFTSDLEQTPLSTCNYQNAGVEVQLSELENSFQKLLGEIDRAQKGEGARTAQEVTIMEVRAEYEDKLSRMKSKMKELFHEEMGRLKKKQADEIAILERELVKCREKMAESSQAYEQHIRMLTTELWSVGEKFLVKQEEADWLRKKQSGSLMSLQHVHSSGLHPTQEVCGRASDTHSLRSLPMHNKKSEARGLHMSDEEGEVFDNRFLKELSATPRASLAPGQRLSELKRRNSLVPPHLKSSYPAEMQFAPTLEEEDIKCASTSFTLGRGQRKEVGITAYKKPGPPTPSKQAGRLSATDSELRESLRVDADPGRKTSTPSRIRSLFRSNRNDTDAMTPRTRRFSSIFRKK